MSTIIATDELRATGLEMEVAIKREEDGEGGPEGEHKEGERSGTGGAPADDILDDQSTTSTLILAYSPDRNGENDPVVIKNKIVLGSKPPQSPPEKRISSESLEDVSHTPPKKFKNVARKSTAKSAVVALQKMTFETTENSSTCVCTCCEKIFLNQDALIAHLLEQVRPPQRECHICKEQFTDQDELTTHMLVHEDDDINVDVGDANLESLIPEKAQENGDSELQSQSDDEQEIEQINKFMEQLNDGPNIVEEPTSLGDNVESNVCNDKTSSGDVVNHNVSGMEAESELEEGVRSPAESRAAPADSARTAGCGGTGRGQTDDIGEVRKTRNVRKYTCTLCKKIFTNPEKAKRHARLVHPGKPKILRVVVTKKDKKVVSQSVIDQSKKVVSESVSAQPASRPWVGVESRPGKLTLYYCEHCNTCMHWPDQSHILKYCLTKDHNICMKCGLSFSAKSLAIHKAYHDKSDITLKDMDVYSIEDKTLILPPMPKYHRCIKCKINVDSKLMNNLHICYSRFKKCEVCFGLFYAPLYPLHVIFHYDQETLAPYITNSNDNMSTSNQQTVQNTDANSSQNELLQERKTGSIRIISCKTVVFKCLDCEVIVMSEPSKKLHKCISERDKRFCEICKHKISYNQLSQHKRIHLRDPNFVSGNVEIFTFESNNKLTNNSKPEENEIKIIYQCAKCEVVTDSYDKIVEHSQYYLKISNTKFMSTECDQCHLNIDDDYWPRHTQQHRASDRYKVLVYHPDTLLGESWFQLFADVPEDDVTHIIDQSLYREIRNVKMYLTKQGLPTFIVYICNVCRTAVSKEDIQQHLSVTCNKSTTCCSECDIPFNEDSCWTKHKQLHDRGVNKLSFKFITFIKAEMTKRKCKYVVYRCDVCTTTVIREYNIKLHVCVNDQDKRKCEICQQTYHWSVMERHSLVHKKYKDFTEDRIDVKYFTPSHDETKSDLEVNKEEISDNTENRTAHDESGNCSAIDSQLEVYKCSACSLIVFSVVSSQKHKCVEDKFKRFCHICGQYYVCQQTGAHKLKHEKEPNFVAGKLNITLFDPSSNKPETKDNVTEMEEEDGIKTYKIYKCDCGLHNLTWKAMAEHRVLCKVRPAQNARTCYECRRVFPARALGTHTALHHARRARIQVEEHAAAGCEEPSSSSAAREPRSSSAAREPPTAKEPHSSPTAREPPSSPTAREPPSSPTAKEPRSSPTAKEPRSSPTARDPRSSPIANAYCTANDPRMTKMIENTQTLYSLINVLINPLVLLFKCVECEVFFTSQSSCAKHVRGHARLSARDFAQCKLCRLQFVTKSLYSHTRTHHAEDSPLQGALVEEYTPRAGDDEHDDTPHTRLTILQMP